MSRTEKEPAPERPTRPAVTSPAAPSSPERSVRLVLAGVLLAMLLAMLDNAIVGTAMPTIVGDLGGLKQVAWVVTAYTLLSAISTPVWGKLGDLFSRKTVFLTSIVVFLAGSVLAGAAWSMPALIGFRALQGLGAGGLAVGAFSIIGALVPPRERGRYQGMTASVMVVGTIGGPLLGGVITDGLDWRWAFYLNVPLGLVALAWCWWMLDLPVSRAKVRIDYAGIVALSTAIASVVLVATWGGVDYAWTSAQVLGAAGVAAVALAAFLAIERRAVEPVVPLKLFRSRNMTLSSLSALVYGVVMFGAVLYLPLFQQTVQGASAASSGLLLLPMMVPMLVVAQVTGRTMSATGRYRIFFVLGGAFLTAGAALLATVDAGTGRLATGLAMALLGAGLGFAAQLSTTIALNSVEPKDMGAASGAVTLFRTVGGSLGVAAFGSIFTRAVAGRTPADKGAYLDAFAGGTGQVFLAVAVVCAAGFVLAWFFKEVPLRGKAPAPAPAPASASAPADTSAS
ncbi:MDR family MFS transporter [Spirillospora sp. NBC_01491]|uniref:MDR family MFS transporter n=1 Tax=Spirillospora sp. NBC_01491 TaxID=2976007 RepID=UPI002E2F9E21|nr:MDR family MFS transporter [Spirillospora sp. NBC_01491]